MAIDIDTLLKEFSGSQRDNLIPILEKIQDEHGYISEEALIKVGKLLKLPASKVFGVSTFYNNFHFQPPARYTFRLCNGTACHVLGANTVLKELETELKIKAGQISRDGTYAIELVPCMGACGSAPVIMVNGKHHTRINSKDLKKEIDNCKKK